MSGILDQIDDTLDNWRGSNDSMHWTPEPDVTVTFTADTSHWVAAMARLQGTLTALADGMCAMQPVFDKAAGAFGILEPYLAEPRPSALNAKYHRRYRNRMGRR